MADFITKEDLIESLTEIAKEEDRTVSAKAITDWCKFIQANLEKPEAEVRIPLSQALGQGMRTRIKAC